MLIAINNVWNGPKVVAVTAAAAADALDAPVIMATIVEKKVPAHVGHAVKKPVAAPPIPPEYRILLLLLVIFLFLFWNEYAAREIFTPTSVDRTTTSTRFIGIINIIKLSDKYAVNIGT